MPSQYSMASTVVAVQHRPCRFRLDAFGECCAFGQMRGVLGTVGVMHLETDDLAAIEIEDQVQIVPTTLDLCRQERHIPAPDLAGAGRDMRCWWARPAWRLGPSPAVHLAMRTHHAMET